MAWRGADAMAARCGRQSDDIVGAGQHDCWSGRPDMKLKILVAILCSLIAAAALCWSYPAAAAALINIPVTPAVSAQVSPTFQLRAGPGAGVVPSSMAVQGTVTGTAGTS